MGKNSKSWQKKLKIAEKKASRPKQVHIGYRNKRRKVEDTEKGGKDGFHRYGWRKSMFIGRIP